ncbi:MAG: hypothetical protein VKO00_11675 [Cyanobacteriota bacterium]|nr:hypothetical protein [Cyanobacteriota bacterium]
MPATGVLLSQLLGFAPQLRNVALDLLGAPLDQGDHDAAGGLQQALAIEAQGRWI